MASHGCTCEASLKMTTSNGNSGDSKYVPTASGLLIQHGWSRTSRFGTRAKSGRNGRCRFFWLTSAGWPDLIRQPRWTCYCFGVCGEAVPRECQRPIPRLLRGLRNSGTPVRTHESSLELTHILTMFTGVGSECRLRLACLVASAFDGEDRIGLWRDAERRAAWLWRVDGDV